MHLCYQVVQATSPLLECSICLSTSACVTCCTKQHAHAVTTAQCKCACQLTHSGCSNRAGWCRPNVGLVIEGAALATALLRHNAQPFLGLCQACQGVVCCRVTPMQKAQVVSLVKRSGAITLGNPPPKPLCTVPSFYPSPSLRIHLSSPCTTCKTQCAASGLFA